MSLKTRDAYREYLKTPHWDNLRKQALIRDGYQCCLCRASNRILQVHHKVYRDTWEQTDLCDLQTLCVPCHESEHQARRSRQRPKQKCRKKGWRGKLWYEKRDKRIRKALAKKRAAFNSLRNSRRGRYDWSF